MPGTMICQSTGSGTSPSWSSDVKQSLSRLDCLWHTLTSPEMIATLDTALRMRSLGHWSIVLADRANVRAETKDCRDIRANLLIPKAGRARKNESFLRAPGLLDVFEDSMSGPMICMLVDDIHLNAMREKAAFQEYVAKAISTTCPEDRCQKPTSIDNSTFAQETEAESDFQCLFHSDHSCESATHASIDHQHPAMEQDFASHGRSLQSESDLNEPLGGHKAHVAAALHKRRAGSRDSATIGVLHDIAQSARKRHRGPRPMYALDLYKKSSMSSQDPQTPKLEPEQHEACHSRLAIESAQGYMQMSADDNTGDTPCITKPDTPIEETPQQSTTDTSEHSVALMKMAPPPLEGTWSMSKSELYARLPSTPKYAVTPPTLHSCAATHLPAKSFKFMGIRVKIEKV